MRMYTGNKVHKIMQTYIIHNVKRNTYIYRNINACKHTLYIDTFNTYIQYIHTVHTYVHTLSESPLN